MPPSGTDRPNAGLIEKTQSCLTTKTRYIEGIQKHEIYRAAYPLKTILPTRAPAPIKAQRGGNAGTLYPALLKREGLGGGHTLAQCQNAWPSLGEGGEGLELKVSTV